jgi:hypothetical protein
LQPSTGMLGFEYERSPTDSRGLMGSDWIVRAVMPLLGGGKSRSGD